MKFLLAMVVVSLQLYSSIAIMVSDWSSLKNAVEAAAVGSSVQVELVADLSANATVVVPISANVLVVGNAFQISSDSGFTNSTLLSISPNATLELSGVAILDITGSNDGVIHNQGSLTLKNSILYNNTAVLGVINNDGGGDLSMVGSILVENQAEIGGGIYNQKQSTVSLSASTLLKNIASIYGGGLVNVNGTVTLTKSFVLKNSAPEMGGIGNFDSVTIIDSTVSGNAATVNFAGGIYNAASASLSVDASRITLNSAKTSGGGVVNFGDGILQDSCVSGNVASIGANVKDESGLLLQSNVYQDCSDNTLYWVLTVISGLFFAVLAFFFYIHATNMQRQNRIYNRARKAKLLAGSSARTLPDESLL